MAPAAVANKAAAERSNAAQPAKIPISRRKRPHPTGSVGQVALVLQGGGSLGAYQVGVLRALDESGYRPEWFAGTSIGAINAAIMAGNARKTGSCGFTNSGTRFPVPPSAGRWLMVVPGVFLGPLVPGRPSCRASRGFSNGTRTISPWLAPPGTPAAMSYYVADQLRQTLDEIVDLERINRGSIRLSLGAVKVTTGEQIYFDSRTQRIGYQHIMAIAALPPSFPPIEIDRGWYWDGGIVSNTPLDAIIDQLPKHPLLHG